MCFLSLAVGIIAGLGAWVFRMLIGLFHNLFFLGQFQFVYDANRHTSENPCCAGIVFAPVIGAIIVAWIVKTFAPEAKGHGVPEVMDAIYYQGGNIRPVVAVVKSLASAICIGSGGSVGREGPIVQIGSAFGSTVGQLLNVPARQRITLVAAGAAGGIAATFNAPLGGIVFAIELLLVSVNVRTLLPVSIATVTATYIGQLLLGTHPSFDLEVLRTVDFQLQPPGTLLLFIPFGLLMGLASILFVKGIYWSEDAFDAMPGNVYTRHCTGMLIVGLILWGMFQWKQEYFVEGVGYGTIMDVLAGRLTDPGFLLLLGGLKLLTTFLTLGSGGSGGVFSPSLFIGATLGAAVGYALQKLFPALSIDILMFAIAGMAAVMGASTGAIITGSVMLREMTDDDNVVLPVIVATVIACGVRKWFSPGSVYTLKLMRRGHVVPEGLQAALDDARNVSHVMSSDYQVVEEDAEHGPSYDVVTIVTVDGELKGVIGPWQWSLHPHDAGAMCRYVLVSPSEPLLSALRKMQMVQASVAVVTTTTESHQVANVVGVLTRREMIRYRGQLAELFA